MKKNKKLDKAIKQAVRASFKNSNLDEPRVKTFVKIFSSLNVLDARYCLRNYLNKLRTEINSRTLIIESPVPLSKPQINILKRDYQKTFAVSAVNTTINPSLISGLKVIIGDNVFEDSLNSRINQLKQAIMA